MKKQTKIETYRLFTIKSGYDHYWGFHKDYKKWAALGCPSCKTKLGRNSETDFSVGIKK